MAATGTKAPQQTTSSTGTTLADTSSVFVVKRTFLELVDKTASAVEAGGYRRVSSDPGLFESCEQEQLRCAAAAPDDVEFDITGLSDTETNPGELVQATSVDAGTVDSTDPSEHGSDEPINALADAHAAESSSSRVSAPACSSSAALPKCLQLPPESDSTLSRLVSENARLALENKLLRENARLAMENKMLSQGMSEGSMAFASWWKDQCKPLKVEEVGAMPAPSQTLPTHQHEQTSRVWAGPAPPARRVNRQQDQHHWMQQHTLGAMNERAAPGRRGGADHGVAENEERTTVMLRNLPNNYSRAMVLAMLNDEGFAGKYNFLYLPIDFKSRACLGYAFINLVDMETTAAFWNTFNGFSKWMLPSKKICSVSWSGPHQGLEAHIERYRNSPVMHASVPDEYKPVLFEGGVRIVFPAPSKTPRAPRVRNNREHTGL